MLKQNKPNWCVGCGNYGILAALKKALSDLNLEPHNTVVIGGIGCGGMLPYWLHTYSFIGLHGRALAIATGIKLSKSTLHVIVVAGDGDTYGIGMNHFINCARRDVNILCIVSNNGVYGLTKGQASPTAPRGFQSPTTPNGNPYNGINPLNLALASGCNFVSRGYAGNVAHLIELIKQGISHKGFALLDVLQPCTTFNKQFNYAYYQEKTKPIEINNINSDIFVAYKLANIDTNIPIGIYYKKKYEE